MKTYLFEATNGFNWGKFMVGELDSEFGWRSQVDVAAGRSLFTQIGWNPRALWVLDLQTCEGAAFTPGGLARADLEKHRIWVCPLFEPFLVWLYRQDVADLAALPQLVELPGAESALAGYRRPGPSSGVAASS